MRIKKLASVIIGSSFLFPALKGLIALRFVETFHVTPVTIQYGIDGFLLITGLLLLILSAIFNYGCYLQTEYDETI